LTDSCDRTGARLARPSLKPAAILNTPSEAIVHGSIEVSGDGVLAVLLADHRTAGGYPKIAMVVSDQMDGFVQQRSFRPLSLPAAYDTPSAPR
jgi:allophanate hydrolase subunit 2